MLRAYLVLSLLALSPLAAAQEPAPKTASKNPVAVMKTNKGTIEIELFEKEAPKTVANFIGLAEGTKPFTDAKTNEKNVKRPFFDGLIFHRVIKGFMIQGGDPLGNGSGGPGYAFADEISAKSLGLDEEKVFVGEAWNPRIIPPDQQRIQGPAMRKLGITDEETLNAKIAELKDLLRAITVRQAYESMGYAYDDALESSHPVRGVIAMANSGPNTNGSQFFINLGDTPHLAGKHTVFGKVVKGMDVVDAIGNVPVAAGAKPVQPVKIESLTIRRPDAKDAGEKPVAPEKKKGPVKRDSGKKDRKTEG